MCFPLSSGAVARLLGLREPQLNDLIRRGRIRCAPEVVAGRRLWMREHILSACRDLDRVDVDLEKRFDEIRHQDERRGGAP